VQEVGGQCGSPVTIPEIAYHAVLVRLPRSAVQSIVNHEEVRLLHSEAVMHFRPTGQCQVPFPDEEEAPPLGLPPAAGTDGGLPPVVALLDGLPLENHSLLAGRLVVDDPDGWGVGYPASDRQHGTSMASLILHGDLGSGEQSLSRP